MLKEINSIFTIAYRDFTKFLRDRQRIVFTFVFPFLFIGVLGNSLQANLGDVLPYDFIVFTFTGVLAQTLFQSTASGLISLIEDRENDFAQEMFISPASRYSIIIGKIVGEGAVAAAQGLGVMLFGLIVGVEISVAQALLLIPGLMAASLLGGAFGVIVMANLKDQKSASQIFPLLIFPQFFLAGVFSPIRDLPAVLLVLSRISPMTYAVDFVRGLFYTGRPEEYNFVVLNDPLVNLGVMVGMFFVLLFLGTWMFVRNERNR